MPKQFEDILSLATKNGLLFEHHPKAYEQEVVTCEDAAKARGILISNELKHMIVYSHQGYCLVHVTGDRFVDLTLVANVLEVTKANIADLTSIPIGRFQRGTICPFKEHLWKWLHVVDKLVLSKDWMTTNDGTMRGYLRFNPKLLSYSANHIIANVSQKDLNGKY